MDNYDFYITTPAGAPHGAEDMGLMLLEGKNGREYQMGGHKPDRFALTSDLNYRSVSTEDDLPLAQTSMAGGMGQKTEMKSDSKMYMQGVNVDTGGFDYWTHGLSYSEVANLTAADALGSYPFKFIKFADTLYMIDVNGFIYTVGSTLAENWPGTVLVTSEVDSEWHNGGNAVPSTLSGEAPDGSSDCVRLTVAAGAGVENLAYGDVTAAPYNASQDYGCSLWIRSSIAMDAGDLQVWAYNDTGVGADSNGKRNLPALEANTWKLVQLRQFYDSIAPNTDKNDIERFYLYQAVDKGACTIDIWRVRSFSSTVSDAVIFYSADYSHLNFVMCYDGNAAYDWFEDNAFTSKRDVTATIGTDLFPRYIVHIGDGVYYMTSELGNYHDIVHSNDITQDDIADTITLASYADGFSFLGISARGYDYDSATQLLVGTYTSGLYQQYTGTADMRLEIMRSDLAAVKNYHSYMYWRGYEYWLSNGDLYAWDNLGLHNISPAYMIPEAYPNHGEIKAIAHDGQWMYVGVNPADGGTQARILKLRFEVVDGSPQWNYHGCIARFAAATEIDNITAMEVHSTTGNPKLYIGGEDSGGDPHLFEMELPFDPEDTAITRSSSAIMEYSGMTGEFPTTNKVFRSIRVHSENLDANNYLTVKYRVTPHDGENGGTTGWTTLGTTFTTSPVQTIDLPAGVDGETIWIRAESTWNGGSDPVPRYILIQVNSRIAEDTDGTGNDRKISMVVDLADHRMRLDGCQDRNSREHVVAQLEYLRDSGESFSVKERFSGETWSVTYLKPSPVYREFEYFNGEFRAGVQIELLEA